MTVDSDKLRDEIIELRVEVATLEAVAEEREKAVNAALVAADKAVAAALAAAKEAVTKAEAASEKRFDSVNEFRATLSDQATSFMPRKEYDARHSDLTRQVNELRDGLATIRTSIAVGPAGLAPLESRAARQDGNREGSHQVMGALYAIGGLVVGLGGLVVALVIR